MCRPRNGEGVFVVGVAWAEKTQVDLSTWEGAVV